MTPKLTGLHPVLRIARPTDRLREVTQFYQTGLGFQIFAEFEDHAGFDGVILGNPRAPYHLEFTHQRGHSVGSAPSKDNLLVFYLPDKDEFSFWLSRLQTCSVQAVPPLNPYWDVRGKTFEDPDGYRIVLQHAPWTA